MAGGGSEAGNRDALRESGWDVRVQLRKADVISLLTHIVAGSDGYSANWKLYNTVSRQVYDKLFVNFLIL